MKWKMSESTRNLENFSPTISLLTWRPREVVQGHAVGGGAGLDCRSADFAGSSSHSSQSCLVPSHPPPPTHEQFLSASCSKHTWNLTTSLPPSLSPGLLPWLSPWPPTAILVPGMSTVHTATIVILLIKQLRPYPSSAQTFQRLLISLRIKSHVLPEVIKPNHVLLSDAIYLTLLLLGCAPLPWPLWSSSQGVCTSLPLPRRLFPQISHFLSVLFACPEHPF